MIDQKGPYMPPQAEEKSSVSPSPNKLNYTWKLLCTCIPGQETQEAEIIDHASIPFELHKARVCILYREMSGSHLHKIPFILNGIMLGIIGDRSACKHTTPLAFKATED